MQIIFGSKVFNNQYRSMELQTTNSNIKLDSTRRSGKSTNRYKSKRAIQGRRNGQLRQKTIVEFRKDLFQRFQQFNMAQSFAKVYNTLQKAIGRHSVIAYSQQYNFKQQWEVSNRYENKEEYRTTFTYGLLNFLILIIVNFCLWGISVKVFFEIQNSEWVHYVVAAICVVKISRNLPRIQKVPFKDKIMRTYKQLLCIAISIICSILQKYWSNANILGIIVLILLYIKSSKLYQHIKIFHVSSKHRQIVEIIDLFVLLLTVSHIFALLLYATTHLNTSSNWMTKIYIYDEPWLTKYIYSLYFSCTTLLTVGYGDVSPTNIAQILTILLTELIGIATFAYAVNKIGVALTNITERTQKLQKDLGNVEYIGNQYKLKPDIVCRMRTQLIKDKNLDSELNLNQQNQLFSKFSQDLRQQIQIQSSMRVIKRSMFMIGNWTGKLQSKIARKLIKQIYAIDQNLPQTPGKEKIYILDKGKIDIINNSRSGFKKCFQKILKTLSVSSSSQVVVQNVYGYSAVISNRQIHLNAIAKLNSICYSLTRNDLYELLAQSQQDLQHFHQIKSKIDLSKIPQQIEAPAIINFRQHFSPSVHYIILQNFHKQHIKNKRSAALRYKRRMRTTILSDNISSNTIFSKKQRIFISNYGEEMSAFMRFQQTQQQKADRQFQEIKYEEFIQNQIIGFQACKQYQRYFKKSNYENVLNRLKTKICTEKFSYINNIGHSVDNNRTY